MAVIKFKGMCNGTQKKMSQKGNEYSITEFVDIGDAGMGTFKVFGELGLSKSMELKEYAFNAKIVELADVQVIPKASKP